MSRYQIAKGIKAPPPYYRFDVGYTDTLFFVLNTIRPASLIWNIDGSLPQIFWECIKQPLDVEGIFVSIFDENPLANERPEEDIDAVLQDVPMLADDPHTWLFDKDAFDELDVGDSHELYAMIEKVANKQELFQKLQRSTISNGVPWVSREQLIYQVEGGYVKVPGRERVFPTLQRARDDISI